VLDVAKRWSVPADGFQLSGDLAKLQEAVRRFLREEVLPLERDLDYEAVGLPDDELRALQAKAQAEGLWLPGAPQALGGMELPLIAHTVLAEEASQHRLGAYNPALGAFGEEPSAVLYTGTPEQIERYVRPTLEGAKRTFTAFSEPGGGSDPARAIRTSAVRRGSTWILNGQKKWISGSLEADYGLVFARTGEGRNGITAFIVDTDSPGFSREEVPVIRPWYPGLLTFENVEVPEENVLGEVGRGFELAQRHLVKYRVPYTAGCIGIGIAALRRAIEYAKEREVFKSRLADKQAIQWMIADSEIELRSARWLLYEAAWKADRGEDCRYESSSAKVFATEVAGRVVDRAIQIHGGMGVAKENPFERWYRELRIKRIGEGPSEVHRMVVARDLLSGRVTV
jgi:acyl-CoA dehydrogenase